MIYTQKIPDALPEKEFSFDLDGMKSLLLRFHIFMSLSFDPTFYNKSTKDLELYTKSIIMNFINTVLKNDDEKSSKVFNKMIMEEVEKMCEEEPKKAMDFLKTIIKNTNSL